MHLRHRTLKRLQNSSEKEYCCNDAMLAKVVSQTRPFVPRSNGQTQTGSLKTKSIRSPPGLANSEKKNNFKENKPRINCPAASSFNSLHHNRNMHASMQSDPYFQTFLLLLLLFWRDKLSLLFPEDRTQPKLVLLEFFFSFLSLSSSDV